MSYPRDANNTLVLNLASRGHLRDAYAALRGQPFADDGSGIELLQLSELGAVPRAIADTVFRGWSKGSNFGLVVLSLPWSAMHGDTASIRAIMQRARSRPDNGAARDAARFGAMYLALARKDTTAALRMLSDLPQAAETIWLWARLLEAQHRDAAAAAVLDWHGTEGPLYVLQRLEQAQIAERLGYRDEALRSYQFVIDMWRRADPELQPEVSEARAALLRLSGEKSR
jgi:hypothetical protein